MKIIKLISYGILAMMISLSLALWWLFSKSGNHFLQNQITTLLNNQAPIGIAFDHFKLTPTSFAFSLHDKEQSQIAIDGNYSLFGLNGEAKIYGIITNLANYEPLIGMRLNGNLGIQATAKKEHSNLAIKADITAFKSLLEIDALLHDYQPKKLFAKAKNGINLEALLYFLNQPLYASGQILAQANLDLQTSPNGGFKIASQSIKPNIQLLKSYGITIPKTPLQFAINGIAKQDFIITTIGATSDYLILNSENLQTSIHDFSTNGQINLQAKQIRIQDFLLKPITIQTNLKATNTKNQEATLSLQALSNPILAHITLPNFSPHSITLQAKDLDMQELLHFASLPYSAKGQISLDSKIENIQLSPLQYKLQGNLTNTIESFSIQKFSIAQNNTLQANFKGNNKLINIDAKTDLFDSNLNAKAKLNAFLLDGLILDANHINLAKLAAIFGYEAKGLLDIQANIANFNQNLFDANFHLNSKEIIASKSMLNKLSGLDFKHDIPFRLNAEGKIEKGKGESVMQLSNAQSKLELSQMRFNLKDNQYQSNLHFSTSDISTINPLQNQLQGPLELDGFAKLENNIPTLLLQTPTFGKNLSIDLNDQKLKLTGQQLDLKKIATFSGSGKFIKAGEFNLASELSIKGTNAKEIIQNLNGPFELVGEKIEIYTLDIDGLVKNFEKTNKINLLDIGAFVLAGPIGIAATKGTSLGTAGFDSLVQTKTAIKKLVAKLAIKNGVAQAKDLAFATTKTRIAAQGAINFNTNTFENFIIGVLDDKNCATISQKIQGSLDNPKIELTQTAISTALNLASSLFGQIKKGAQTITRQKTCTPFYHGSIAKE